MIFSALVTLTKNLQNRLELKFLSNVGLWVKLILSLFNYSRAPLVQKREIIYQKY